MGILEANICHCKPVVGELYPDFLLIKKPIKSLRLHQFLGTCLPQQSQFLKLKQTKPINFQLSITVYLKLYISFVGIGKENERSRPKLQCHTASLNWCQEVVTSNNRESRKKKKVFSIETELKSPMRFCSWQQCHMSNNPFSDLFSKMISNIEVDQSCFINPVKWIKGPGLSCMYAPA